jgi:hypothetical protein
VRCAIFSQLYYSSDCLVGSCKGLNIAFSPRSNESFHSSNNSISFFAMLAFISSRLLKTLLVEYATPRRISPVAWQHLHFLRHYAFRDKRHPIDLDAISAGIEWGEFNRLNGILKIPWIWVYNPNFGSLKLYHDCNSMALNISSSSHACAPFLFA